MSCPSPGDGLTWPTLSGDFTRCDLVDAANAGFTFAFVVSVVVVFLLAIIAFRGK